MATENTASFTSSRQNLTGSTIWTITNQSGIDVANKFYDIVDDYGKIYSECFGKATSSVIIAAQAEGGGEYIMSVNGGRDND